MSDYIWYKNGKEVKRSKDPEGKIITRKITGHNTYIDYNYVGNNTLWNEVHYKNSKRHRDGDKPAVIWYYEYGSISGEGYYKNGKIHREGDKPAAIGYSTDGSSISSEYYYKNGKKYTPPTKA